MERQRRSKSPSRSKSPRLSKLFTDSLNRNILLEINKYLGTQDEGRMRQVSKSISGIYGGSETALKGKIQKLKNLIYAYENFDRTPLKNVDRKTMKADILRKVMDSEQLKQQLKTFLVKNFTNNELNSLSDDVLTFLQKEFLIEKSKYFDLYDIIN
jgi:hypothetical protein